MSIESVMPLNHLILCHSLLLHTHISIHICIYTHIGFLGDSAVKNPLVLPNMQKTLWVQSLGQEDPLEEGMATQSSILAWGIPWTDHGVTKRHN